MGWSPDIGEPTLRSLAEFYRAFPQQEWVRSLFSLYGDSPIDDAAELFEMNGIDKKHQPSVADAIQAVSQKSGARQNGIYAVKVVQDGDVYPRSEFESGSAKMREMLRDDVQSMGEDLGFEIGQFILHGTVAGDTVSSAIHGLLDDTAVGTGIGVVGRPVTANATPGTEETAAGGYTGITRVGMAPIIDVLNAIHRIVTSVDSTRSYRQLISWAQNMTKTTRIDIITNPQLLHRLNWPAYDGTQYLNKTYLQMYAELGINVWPDPSIIATLTDNGNTDVHAIFDGPNQGRYAEWRGGMRTDGPELADQRTNYWIRRAWKGGAAFKSRKIGDYFVKSHVRYHAIGYKST
jgi:hypothetical protein